MVIACEFSKTDDLIREDNTVKLYKDSEQYRKDKNIESLEEANRKLKAENKDLTTLAEREIRNKLRKRSYEEITDFDRQKYFSYYGK